MRVTSFARQMGAHCEQTQSELWRQSERPLSARSIRANGGFRRRQWRSRERKQARARAKFVAEPVRLLTRHSVNSQSGCGFAQ